MKTLLALAASLALTACQSTATEAPSEAGEMPSMEEMMAMMEELAKPGENHAALGDMVGTFDTQMKIWMSPEDPPMESTGTMVNTWMMGQRYLQGSYNGSMDGAPFTGISITGYDNATETYQSTWFDSMSTGILPLSTGTRDGNTFEFQREMFDPMSQTMVAQREVIIVDGPDSHTMRMYAGTPDGGWVQSMELIYTRRK